jgi:hypothetical protein
VYWAVKLATGRRHDLQRLQTAALDFVWLVPALVPMILIASVIGTMVGIGMKYSSGLREGAMSVLFWRATTTMIFRSPIDSSVHWFCKPATSGSTYMS